jgi:ATP-dependent helicase/nuclease subunit B
LPPLSIGEGDDKPVRTGIADRIDGWLHDGKLYIRVVDYKTGKKKLRPVRYLVRYGLQMLLYLFTLGKAGRERYGYEIVPAGVLYVPARDVLVKSPGNISDDEILESKTKNLRRSGLILDDPDVIDAMENGETPKYIPVTFNKDGKLSAGAWPPWSASEGSALYRRHAARSRGRIEKREHRGRPIFPQPAGRCVHMVRIRGRLPFRRAADSRRYLRKLKPEEFWGNLEGGREVE